jgi:3-dehydroquinate synthase
MEINLSTGTEKITQIYTGPGVFVDLREWLDHKKDLIDSVFIFTDSNTRACCLKPLTDQVPFLLDANILEIQAGEKQKSLQSAEYLWQQLTLKGASRKSLLINLGGGVVTDLGGFVASTYKRGIPFVHVPTTLLGMTDAAIGGKTGVNLGEIKNQVGTFTAPDAIFISEAFLETLPSEELLSGFAEIIKIALVADSQLWENLQTLNKDVFTLSKRGNGVWNEIVSVAVQLKCRIVEQDFTEQGLREILNFGHTIGHAFESFSLLYGKNPLSHGNAIAIGIICESFLSVKKTCLQPGVLDAIVSMIFPRYLQYHIPEEDIPLLIDMIGHDKKRIGSGNRFSLISSPGNSHHGVCCERDEILECIRLYRSLQ